MAKFRITGFEAVGAVIVYLWKAKIYTSRLWVPRKDILDPWQAIPAPEMLGLVASKRRINKPNNKSVTYVQPYYNFS